MTKPCASASAAGPGPGGGIMMTRREGLGHVPGPVTRAAPWTPPSWTLFPNKAPSHTHTHTHTGRRVRHPGLNFEGRRPRPRRVRKACALRLDAPVMDIVS